MRLLGVYQEQIRGIQKEAMRATAQMPAVEYLKSLPGLGEVLAPIAALEIGDIRRFRDAGSFASYCGLVPSVYASGGKAWHGTTQHSGNHWLKWVFVEAAWVAIRCMPELRQRFDRTKQRRGVHVAIVACARHLSEIAYALLKQQRCFMAHPLVYA
jgi:transposase